MKKEISISPVAAEALRRFGENLAVARQARNWSQEEAAKRSKMSRTTYRAIELGKTSVSIGQYLSVADLYGLADSIKHVAAPHLDNYGSGLKGIKGRHN